ncbi:MAG: hypothetical protein AB8B48_15185 [Pseudomonadales bacterium]
MSQTFASRVLIIPSAVFLSVVFGGSYGTGREVMEFVSQHGPKSGVLALASVSFTYGVLLFLCFEISRRFQQFEYRGFFKPILGRAWVLYEVVILIGMVITLAICVTAAGVISESRFGFPPWVGSAGLLLIIFLLNYRGRHLVQKSMVFSVGALFCVLVALLFVLFNGHTQPIVDNFRGDEVDWSAWQGGMQYALVNGGFIPLLLYCGRGLQSRGQSLLAGSVAALVAVIPGAVFHYAFMSAWPAIKDQELPTYWLIDHLASPMFLNVYVVVLFVLIAQTGVGMLQGFLERMDAWRIQREGEPLSPLGHGVVAVGMVLVSMLLSRIGIVALILTGYSILAMAFIVVFVIPLVTRGVYLVFRSERQQT